MTICYGMLCDVHVEILVPLLPSVGYQGLLWDGARELQNPTDGTQLASLTPSTAQMLQTLSSKARTEFQFWLSSREHLADPERRGSERSSGMGGVSINGNLSVILYGPKNMADPVAEWLDGLKMYLQVPWACDRDVPYINPHCLASGQEAVVYTSKLPSDLVVEESEVRNGGEDPFFDLYNTSIFDLAPQPSAIASKLHAHQRQALTFMIERENGWNLSGTRKDIWKSYLTAFGDTRYKNTVSGLTQAHPPVNFQGGIIADEMGLGKTCTMLGLIAANPFQSDFYHQSSDCLKGTLIVVPFPLLFVWEKQIQEHFYPGKVRHAIFYGRDRQKETNLKDYEIVVTTYNTVALEWKNYKASRNSSDSNLLFSAFWHRIILDEAHVIRSKDTVCAKSVYALQADRRWCITGTPIQNRLADIFSLLRFLKVHPYDDLRTFEEQILRPWKSKTDENALKRLQLIMKAISIRRPRAVIALPDRSEHTEEVVFTDEERGVYDSARVGVMEVLENAIHVDQSTSGSIYLNAFQRINDLRYICNHGVTPPRRRNHTSSMDTFEEGPCPLPDDKLEAWIEGKDILCICCGAELLEEEEGDNDRFLSELHARRPAAAVTASIKSTGISSPTSSKMPMQQPSSKIKALISQIRQLPLDDKCVVFSYWTSSLDAVEAALNQAQVRFCRYDGRLSRPKRNQVLTEFTNDASLRVLLVSITCGGQGLDLTAANHAYLLEPQWNPMLEEQAMARVHRLGQEKAVRLVRFLMKDTFEENIVRLQRRKRTLADLIVDRTPLKAGTDGKKQLYYLRELVE
ncbi:hypothetical protein PV08_11331 [Exophiala spinifera]|uniref:Uncharacterized protein n=1 Tax=Exophiala spinifera TaxID=91928 RepID=A0A0D2BG81_9EURO|nr:uncharacterized protein PV08_11331 [Exophiala spinifera]KIW10369.1 hypothetical protein PV08_11331 [Exophiala spinifera]